MVTQKPLVPNWEKIRELLGKIKDGLDTRSEKFKAFSQTIKPNLNKKVEKLG